MNVRIFEILTNSGSKPLRPRSVTLEDEGNRYVSSVTGRDGSVEALLPVRLGWCEAPVSFRRDGENIKIGFELGKGLHYFTDMIVIQCHVDVENKYYVSFPNIRKFHYLFTKKVSREIG